MKQIMILAALVAALAGCKSIEVERHAQQVATYTDTNGVVKAVCDNAGKPVILDGGWCVDYLQHWNWQKFDELSATAGTGVSLTINKYESGADSNLVALVSTSLDGLTKLAVAVGEAYVKIAGGGAQADTVLKTTSKIINYFRDKGGNVEKATVTTDETSGTLKIDDGTTCVSCDASRHCTECTKTP